MNHDDSENRRNAYKNSNILTNKETRQNGLAHFFVASIEPNMAIFYQDTWYRRQKNLV